MRSTTDPFIEHYNRKILCFEMDEDVAEMQIAAYRERGSAIRKNRDPLAGIARPKALKHQGERTARKAKAG